MFSSGNALPCNAVSRILAALLAVVASLPGLADTEEVTHDYGRLTLNANLDMADGKQFEDGMVLIVHGLMGHNRMQIIEKSQILLQEQGLSSLAINISLGVNSRHVARTAHSEPLPPYPAGSNRDEALNNLESSIGRFGPGIDPSINACRNTC